MHALSLLENWCSRNSFISHKARLGALLKAVRAVLDGAKLSLTHIGRRRPGNAFVKHHIKAIDRLLANRALHSERPAIYAGLAESILSASQAPLVLIDWADCELERQFLILKAAVPAGGRALTIYEEVHPLTRYNNPATHRAFLNNLKAVLPEHVQPIIVTDAGFRGPWFKAVEALGWHYIGRVRNAIKYFDEDTQEWVDTREFYCTATAKVKHLGRFRLARRHHYFGRLYLVRAKRDKRTHRPKPKSYANNDRLYRKLNQAPWLLITSMEHTPGSGRRIQQAYARRMQIEETFRDLKNHRWGLALRYARSNSCERLQTMLLIAALATFALWLLGMVARENNWARHFQANTERRRAVLATTFLGQQLWNSQRFRPTYAELREALSRLPNAVAEHALLA